MTQLSSLYFNSLGYWSELRSQTERQTPTRVPDTAQYLGATHTEAVAVLPLELTTKVLLCRAVLCCVLNYNIDNSNNNKQTHKTICLKAR